MFESGLPVTMIGLNLTHQARATTRGARARARAAGRAGARASRAGWRSSAARYERVHGEFAPPVHDPCTVALLIDPTLIRCVDTFVAVETEGRWTRGATVVDLNGRLGRPPNARVAMELDAPRFWDLVLGALRELRPGRSSPSVSPPRAAALRPPAGGGSAPARGAGGWAGGHARAGGLHGPVDADPLARVRTLVHAVPLGSASELERRAVVARPRHLLRQAAVAPVGAMSMVAGDFARMRSAETGSWLLPEWRGRGLGREAREAMLHLLFEGLGAREARSSAHPDNAPSHAVSRALGYRTDGTLPHARGRRRAGDGDPPPPHPRALAPADRRRARGLGGVQAAVRAP